MLCATLAVLQMFAVAQDTAGSLACSHTMSDLYPWGNTLNCMLLFVSNHIVIKFYMCFICVIVMASIHSIWILHISSKITTWCCISWANIYINIYIFIFIFISMYCCGSHRNLPCFAGTGRCAGRRSCPGTHPICVWHSRHRHCTLCNLEAWWWAPSCGW